MKKKFKKGDTLVGVIEFKCPFCGGVCFIADPPSVAHIVPYCETFDKLEAHEFLRAVNHMKVKEN